MNGYTVIQKKELPRTLLLGFTEPFIDERSPSMSNPVRVVLADELHPVVE